MAFNAHWKLEELADQRQTSLPRLLQEFKGDFAEMVRGCPAFRLAIVENGNKFALYRANGEKYNPDSVAGFYSIFSHNSVVYFGRADNLRRRVLDDPDNTANSTYHFAGNQKAILKLLLHRGWAEELELAPLLMQLYPGSYHLAQRQQTFDEYYQIDKYACEFEGLLRFFIQPFHHLMIARVIKDSFLS